MANIIIKYSADTQSFEDGTDKVVAGIDEVKVKEQEAQKTTNDFVNTMKNGIAGIKTTEVVKEFGKLGQATIGITAEQKKLSNEILNTLTADKKFMQEAQKVAKAYEQGLITDIEATEIFENAINAASNEIEQLGGNNEQATGQVKSLKAQLRELTQLITSGQLEGDELQQATLNAARLKDSIGDVNDEIRFLSSDTKYADALVSGAQQVTAGFQIAAGATALFGDENEDVQKAMLKLNAIMQISMGLQQLSTFLKEKDIAKTVIQTAVTGAYGIVVGTTTGALKLFRLALAATGIGLLILGIGLLIANFDKIKKAVTENSEGFQNFKKVLTFLFPVIGLIVKGIELIVRNFDKIKQVVAGVGGALNSLAKTAGDVIGSLLNLDFKGVINSFKKAGTESAKAYGEASKQELEKQQKEIQNKILNSQASFLDKQIALNKAKGKETTDAEIEKLKKLSLIASNALSESEAFEFQRISAINKRLQNGDQLTEAEAKQYNNQSENVKKAFEAIDALNIAKLERDKNINDKSIENSKKAAERQKAINEKAEEDRKNSIRNLDNLGKLLSNAKAVLNTEIVIGSSQQTIDKAKESISKLEDEIKKLQIKIEGNEIFDITPIDLSNLDFKEVTEDNLKDAITPKEPVKVEVPIDLSTILINEQAERDKLVSVLSGGIDDATKLIEDSELSSALNELLKGALKVFDSFDEQGKEKVLGIVGGVLEIASSITNILDSVYQKNIDILDRQLEAQNDRIQKAVEIADEGNAALLEGEENKYARLDELRKEQAKKQKAIAIVQAVINTALAVTSALTQAPPASYILAALSAALGAVQIGIIASQSFKKGGQIGLIDAPSHEQGGGKFSIKNKPNYVGEYEGGEYIFDKAYTNQNLEAIKFIHKNRINLNNLVGAYKNNNNLDSSLQDFGGVTINKHNQIIQLQASYEELLNEVRLLPSRMPMAQMYLDADGLTTRMINVNKKKDLIRSKLHD